MNKMNREDIRLIRRHSEFPPSLMDRILTKYVYNDANMWKKFLHLFFLVLAAGFTISGIIFFFAYNWDNLPKFVKLGMLEVLVIATIMTVLFTKLPAIVKNVTLTGATFLVGALFAVFGQIYQTGADAYDLFFTWTAAVTLWVVVSNFAPLWLTYLTLINTTAFLYSVQVAQHWDTTTIYVLLFVFNSLALASFLLLARSKKDIHIPQWFRYIIALAAASFGTIGVCIGIISDFDGIPGILVFLILATLYSGGIIYSLHEKTVSYLSMISFSIIVIVSTFMLKISTDMEMLLLTGLFIAISVTMLIKMMISLQKKWTTENE